MAWCKPKLTGRVPGEWICEVCGFGDVDTAGHFPSRIFSPCGAGSTVSTPVTPCVHRGAELRRVPCSGCGGRRTELKVFTCAALAECTIGIRIDGIACCAGCPSYEAAE